MVVLAVANVCPMALIDFKSLSSKIPVVPIVLGGTVCGDRGLSLYSQWFKELKLKMIQHQLSIHSAVSQAYRLLTQERGC